MDFRALNLGTSTRALGISLLATVALVNLAQAADLPTNKGPCPTLAPGCLASFWTWLDLTAADCPLAYAGFTYEPVGLTIPLISLGFSSFPRNTKRNNISMLHAAKTSSPTALDAGLGYYSQGAAWNPAVFNGTQGLISKQSNGSKWLWSPNNINQSVIGIT